VLYHLSDAPNFLCFLPPHLPLLGVELRASHLLGRYSEPLY
jgi:hypothetical protein